MKNILFPAPFRIVGWALFVSALLLSLLMYIEVISLYGVAETVVNDSVIIGIILGSVFIVCSKEPQEDEMTRAIRLSSLLNALYAYTAIMITGTLLINGVKYLAFIMMSWVLLPVIFVFIFRANMHHYYKENTDEE